MSTVEEKRKCVVCNITFMFYYSNTPIPGSGDIIEPSKTGICPWCYDRIVPNMATGTTP